MESGRAVLLTGATGTLGSLATTALLRRDNTHVVAPVRPHHAPGAVAAAVERELEVAGGAVEPNWRDRLHQVQLPAGVDDPEAPDPLGELDEIARRFGVAEVVHCAGCLSYFDQAALLAVNVEMTRRFVDAAKRWDVSRFVHISTAFSSGFVDGPIPERLHATPEGDPTFYTESKRLGEQIVADSGVPFLILRPSIVIGDSRDGHYNGPRYGLYQLWSGVERFLLDEYHAHVHYVAPRRNAPLLHQNAFQTGFIAALNQLPNGAICHLTSHGGPSIRDLAELFVNKHLGSQSITYYERLADVPLDTIAPAQRAFLAMAAVNIEISSRPWLFETHTLDSLIANGASFTDATLETVTLCQDAYFAGSDRLRHYRERFAGSFPERAQVVSLPTNL